MHELKYVLLSSKLASSDWCA